MTKPDVKTFFDEDTFTCTHLISDPATNHCAIIDSVLDYDPKSGRTATRSADRVVDFVRNSGLQTEWVLETHVHADHITAAPYLVERLGGRTGIGEHVPEVQKTFQKIFNTDGDFRVDGSQFDRLFAEGETFALGDLAISVMHTPGHTPACITYVAGDTAFVGDTLFMPDYGTARVDFPGGDARTLYRSIHRIFGLDGNTRLFMCHDYKAPGRDVYAWETTVAAQRSGNIHIHEGIDEDAFVAMREKRDRELSMPVLILPAVQVNMRAGHLPPPEDNGVSYLKIPVNML